MPKLGLPNYPEVSPDREALRARALALRPELAQADAEIGRADTLIDLARKEADLDPQPQPPEVCAIDRTDPTGPVHLLPALDLLWREPRSPRFVGSYHLETRLEDVPWTPLM